MSRKDLLVHCLAILVGIGLNYGLSCLAGLFTAVPLYLDTIGTVLVAATCGPIPGMLVGIVTNALNVIEDPVSIYYCAVSVIIAFYVGRAAKTGFIRKKWSWPITYGVLVLSGGVLGSLLTWFLYGGAMGSGVTATWANAFYSNGLPAFWSQLFADFLSDMIDKAITVVILFAFVTLMPRKAMAVFPLGHVYQKDYSRKEETKAKIKAQGLSLYVKVTFAIIAISLVSTFSFITVSSSVYFNDMVSLYSEICENTSSTISKFIDGDKIDTYIQEGKISEDNEEYASIVSRLKTIKEAVTDIKYVYVYRMLPEGCEVVFDLDTEDLEADNPGDLIDFDSEFLKYKDALLAGEDMPVVIANGQYGHLMTKYTPIKDSEGNTAAYACVDISMAMIYSDTTSLIVRMSAIMTAIIIFMMSIFFIITKWSLIRPIKAMVDRTKGFQKVGMEHWLESDERKNSPILETKDELQELFIAIDNGETSMCMSYEEIKSKTAEIIKMQKRTVLTLAEIVENRDRNTGDHIARTSFYATIIAKELYKTKAFGEEINADFIDKLTFSAPLHDIGKIAIPDEILNKPGKLSKEEFDLMKTHVIEGKKIIEMAIEGVKMNGYLNMAKEVAAYHHERYDGTGYMEGLKGDAIPLAARIMAVADVFDALVSRRSYKEPFPYETAIGIIKEESGTHFDPRVVDAFLDKDVQDEVVRSLKEKAGAFLESEIEAEKI